jgi:hypothetical protein
MAKLPAIRIEIDGVAPRTPLFNLAPPQKVRRVASIDRRLADRRPRDVRGFPSARALAEAMMLVRKFDAEVPADSQDRRDRLPELMRAVSRALQSH